MKTLLNYQLHSNLEGQTAALVFGETGKLNNAFFGRNRSLSKSEAGLDSTSTKNFSKSESFSFDESSVKEQENGQMQNKVSWDVLCQVINCKVAFKKQFNGKKYNWIQLAGHAGRFKPGEREGYILKTMDDMETNCLTLLQSDILCQFVPKIDRINLNFEDNSYFTEMQDLLYGFTNPCIMDIKIGVRTFIIDESNEKETMPRNDLYVKLINIDPDEPTEEEHRSQAITKRRYMSWRERCTCSATLGFRIEAVKKCQVQEKEFYSMNKKSQVIDHLKNYTDNNKFLMNMYLNRLYCLQENLTKSEFFNSHEMIGSSLLFVHDQSKASIWMIDFGKTRKLPEGVKLKHDVKWEEGTLEDGYLIGIQSLIDIFKETIDN